MLLFLMKVFITFNYVGHVWLVPLPLQQLFDIICNQFHCFLGDMKVSIVHFQSCHSILFFESKKKEKRHFPPLLIIICLVLYLISSATLFMFAYYRRNNYGCARISVLLYLPPFIYFFAPGLEIVHNLHFEKAPS